MGSPGQESVVSGQGNDVITSDIEITIISVYSFAL